ncbi:MAG: radical SAM protein [Desulfobacteraceae bacterium]|nr:radical SAM protein [Desulfobacteraceae bacterium]
MSEQSSIGPIRPPSEAYSLLVRVTRNCPWNRCEFCSVFKGKKFQVRSTEEVKEDILVDKRSMEEVQAWAKQTGYGLGYVARHNSILWLDDDGVKSVFIQDSDSLIMKTEPLVEILEFIRETFPTVERICTYARGKTVFKKKFEELRRLRESGLSRLHIGMETGDDELLAYIKKGATADEMIEAGRKAVKAGFEVSEYIMPGLGGGERWEQHAKNSARVLNEIDPHFIRLRTFHLIKGSPMYEKAQRGEFHMQSIEGVLLEVRRFIEELDVTSELVTSDYAFNYFMGEVDGKLPEDKGMLLKSIDEALAEWNSRGEPKRNPFMGNLTSSLS